MARRWTSVLCDLFQRSLSNCTSQSELLILLAIEKNALRLTAPSLEWALTIQNVYRAASNPAFTCVKCVVPGLAAASLQADAIRRLHADRQYPLVCPHKKKEQNKNSYLKYRVTRDQEASK